MSLFRKALLILIFVLIIEFVPEFTQHSLLGSLVITAIILSFFPVLFLATRNKKRSVIVVCILLIYGGIVYYLPGVYGKLNKGLSFTHRIILDVILAVFLAFFVNRKEVQKERDIDEKKQKTLGKTRK